MAPVRVVLDANVLWPMVLRDTLLRLATPDLGLYEPIWTQRILSDMTRTVIDAGRSSPDRLARTVRLMNETFPDALVAPETEQVEGLKLPDPDDEHVIAAAKACSAQIVVTFNTKDFPLEDVGVFDVEVLTPDQFLMALYRSSPQDVLDTLAQQVSVYRQPPTTFGALLESLASNGLPEFAYTVAAENEIEELEAEVDDYRRSEEEGD